MHYYLYREYIIVCNTGLFRKYVITNRGFHLSINVWSQNMSTTYFDMGREKKRCCINCPMRQINKELLSNNIVVQGDFVQGNFYQ